ncbi:vBcl-2 [Bovine gammaherpesvirus 6]|uniref:VBcl-2 n=1 Tax=Bovine gammaherpesvirus 6 TaxID=1504288 RepID=A0A060CTY6_9GAMA|nr:vBcl-2 [Bovine gammaherpesvirus 6]AIB03162.1 vBcl-2 [Bovine gammaherpesvirus 6]
MASSPDNQKNYLPKACEVKLLFKELSKTSLVIYNVTMTILNPQESLNLSASERVLVYLVKECICDNLRGLVYSVTNLLYMATDEDRIQTMFGIIQKSYEDNEDSFEKFCATLAFVSTFLFYAFDDYKKNAHLVCHLLAGFYLKHKLQWLINVKGLCTGVKQKYPALWFRTRVRMYFDKFTSK